MHIIVGLIIGIVLGIIGAIGGTLYGMTSSNVIGSQMGNAEDFMETGDQITYHIKSDNVRHSH